MVRTGRRSRQEAMLLEVRTTCQGWQGCGQRSHRTRARDGLHNLTDAKMRTATGPANTSFRLLGAAALLAFLSLAPLAHGLPVAGLYEQRVAVENESLTERNRAYQVAFRRMILKVTGDERWLESARIRDASGNAGDYVQAFAYATEETAGRVAGLVGGPALPRSAIFRAPDQSVAGRGRHSGLGQQQAQRAGLDGLAGRKRTAQPAQFAIRRRNHRLHAPLRRGTRPAGQFFRCSTSRTAAISPSMRSGPRTNSPSGRPATATIPTGILAGRLLFTATGELVGLWQFQFMDETQTFDGFDSELESYPRTAADAHYQRIGGAFRAGSGRTERTIGAPAGRRHRRFFRLLGAGRIRARHRPGAGGRYRFGGRRTAELLLDLQGNADQLYDLIALDRNLLPINSGESADSPLLHYRWMR